MKFLSFFLAFYFLVGSFLPAYDFEELGKVAKLWSHYQEHKAKANGKMTLAEFLRLHYDDSNHQKSESHAQLPFKQHLCHCAQYFIPSDKDIKISSTMPDYGYLQPQGFRYVEPSSFDFQGVVWQPPRMS